MYERVDRERRASGEGGGATRSALLPAGFGRELLSWNRTDRDRIEQGVVEPLRAWAAAWGIAAPGNGTCNPPDAGRQHVPPEDGWTCVGPASSGTWCSARSRGEHAASGDASAAAHEAVAGAMFLEPPPGMEDPDAQGRSQPPSIAEEIARSAWRDLLERLTRALKTDDAAGAAGNAATTLGEALAPWSGALVARVACGALEVAALFSPGAIARLLGRPVPARGSQPAPTGGLVPVFEVLESRRVRTRVQLVPVELSLGALVELREGDILCTKHPLDAPLNVHVLEGPRGTGAPVAQGFVGRVDAKLALELTGVSVRPDAAIAPVPPSVSVPVSSR